MNQDQLDAVEHLLLAILKTSKASMPADPIFDAASSSIKSSSGPRSTDDQRAALRYLEQLRKKL
ncbi:hypothetical protein [Pseudomonas sp.]|uniref:hypothetical protein n=1 Tax=Pseudomonas sp. TaxID=306 RepID=UPI00289D0972|nr:hypothetical protein [Pseudomonas sp.]